MVISGPMRLVESISPWDAKEHGPLPLFLLVLTSITGLVDALSYLKLGHVFVANMTGNVVFLGFAVANAQDFSIPASVVAIGAFLVGALPAKEPGSVCLQRGGRPGVVEIAGHPMHAFGDFREVDGPLDARGGEEAGAIGFAQRFARAKQGLGRDAAPVRALAADQLPLHDGQRQPATLKPRRDRFAGDATPETHDVELLRHFPYLREPHSTGARIDSIDERSHQTHSVGSIGRWCRPIPWYEPRCRWAARAGSSTDTIVQWIRRRPSGVMSRWQSTRAARAARPDAGA